MRPWYQAAKNRDAAPTRGLEWRCGTPAMSSTGPRRSSNEGRWSGRRRPDQGSLKGQPAAAASRLQGLGRGLGIDDRVPALLGK
jgi:hypothetical protein